VIAALIMAAGESTRMGRLKQLLPWDGMPLVAWQASQMRDAGVEDVIVVLGHEASKVGAAVPSWARTTVNEAYRDGRATSVRRGAEALAAETEAVLLLNVDQPRPAWLSRLLIENWRTSHAPLVSAKFPRRFGHPQLLDGSLIPELREVAEETFGLRAVVQKHMAQSLTISVSNDAVDVDLNTPDDYDAARAAYIRGEWVQSR
jgi:molybdenum cofactor cytidylyltransferase